ncbi:hypothetical protein Fot_35325 [Forsythia ovata]|uniref:Uncharacterized protein n=1 Tax=Forsythia ovata TaxID=205694 RepID=A0ABD1SL71_9LAMI
MGEFFRDDDDFPEVAPCRESLCAGLCPYEELESNMRYSINYDDFKKKVDDLTSLDDRLEAEVERRTKEVEVYKKYSEAKRLKVNIHCLENDLEAFRTWAEEKDEKL